MITSFFHSSKPSHYIILYALNILAYFKAVLVYAPTYSHSHLFGCLLLLFSLLALNFGVSQHQLTRHNGLVLLFFAMFLFLVPEVVFSQKQMAANLLLMVSLHNIFRLKSDGKIIKKLVDASIAIAIASLIHPAAIIYLPLFIMAIFLNNRLSFQNIIIVILSFASIIFIYYCCSLLFPLIALDFRLIYQFPTLSTDYLLSTNNQILTIYTIIGMLFYIKFLGSMTREHATPHVIVMLFTVFAVVVVLFSKDTSGIIYILSPVAIFMANLKGHPVLSSLTEFCFWGLVIACVWLSYWP